jgi:GT2 family glycosyltransferase
LTATLDPLIEPQPSAPPVVAVVVTCDPGFWLEDTLTSLGAQDYPNLSVLVIDAASAEDPTPRVAAVLPRAYVYRLPTRVGFARAANEALSIVEGASHYLFCHDDVALAADVTRILLEEAFRSNAGVVAPKLVEWDRPDRLLSVGQSADKTGVTARLVELGELDQEQHDSVRDVFCAPGGCFLVRADLFASLDGFDPRIDLLGEDLNLCWRAQVLGARVVVAPGAHVRHLEAMSTGRRRGWEGRDSRRRLHGSEDAHRVRTLLVCYSWFHLVRVLPQALLLSAGEALAKLLTGRPGDAAATLRAWPEAVAHPSGLWQSRWRLQRRRAIGDGEIRRLQVHGSARIRNAIRAHLGTEGDNQSWREVGRRSTQSYRSGTWRLPLAAWSIVAVILLIGSRGMIGNHLPQIGTLPDTSGGISHWWRLWTSGWRPDGLGSPAPAPPALALLSLGGILLIGHAGLLAQILVLGPLVVGPLGAYRAARPLGSPLGRAAALIVYAAVPVPYNALAGGRWSGLLVYAAAPWLLAGIGRTIGAPPWLSDTPGWARVLGLGLLVGVLAAFVPAALVIVVLIGVGMAFGSLLAGRGEGGLRAFGTAVVVAVIATVLLLPWSADVLASRTSLFGVKLSSAGRLGLGATLSFHTGPVGGSALTWGFVAAAGLPLLIGRSWRLVWASRMWGVALVCWAVTWASSRAWLPIPLPAPEILLAPAAAALSLAVALGVVSFEMDLRGYQFGWRQLASTVAAAAVVVGSLPVLGAAIGGRWHLARSGFDVPLGFLAERRSDGPFRALWVGDPRALPLGSWFLEDGVGYATSNSGVPDVTDQWPAHDSGATPLMATDLRLARAGLTSNLGHLLAPLAIRYLVVPTRLAPAEAGGRAVRVPQDILTALVLQSDLRIVQTDTSITVYENAAWAPERLLLPPEAEEPSRSADPRASEDAPLAGAPAVLAGSSSDRFQGQVASDREVFVSQTANGRWKLVVAGQAAPQRSAFGWAMAFGATSGGAGVLAYHTPLTRTLAIVLEMLVWAATAVALMVGWRLRRHRGGDEPAVSVSLQPVERPEKLVVGPALEALDSAVRAPAGSRRRPSRVTEAPGDSEELWQ